MIGALRSFACDERGSTAIEYGLIAALIFVTIVAGFTLVADKMDAKFEAIADGVATNM